VDEPGTKAWIAELQLEPEGVDFMEVTEAGPLDTTGQMLSWLEEAMKGQELTEIIVVDLTQGDIDMPVVHVTVPGLETNARTPLYTPGRRMQRFLRELGVL
jgi:hypothetical protein